MRAIHFSLGLALLGLSIWPGTSLSQGEPAAASKRVTFNDVVPKIEAVFEPATAKRGETVIWRLTIEVLDGWHTYPTYPIDPQNSSSKNNIKWPTSPEVVFAGKLNEPAPALGKKYLEGKLVWERPAVVRPDAKPGKHTVTVPVSVLVCENTCLPPKTVQVAATLTISDEPEVAIDSAYKGDVEAAMRGGTSIEKPAKPTETEPLAHSAKKSDRAGIEAETTQEYEATLAEILGRLVLKQTEDTSLLAFILAGIFWGAVSLVTPCVFPMIPITVSYFLKQSESEHHRPITMASVYCATIVVVLTIAAVLLLSFFRWLSVNPIMNFGLGALFVFFALSLFGMYEIELPAGLARFTSAREGQGGLPGTMFMALTFTILSFACVAPFLGGFGGTSATAKLNFFERCLGGLAFSITFAAPFFVLALFPSLLKKMPKSGSWLNSVKVVMGFLELAAALKFFRLGELVWTAKPAFFTFDLVLGIWVALSLLCGLYLLGFYRLPHDTPAEHVGVPRLMFSLLFLSLGFYLLPALFTSGEGDKPRPRGVIYSWIDSFLLPEPREGKGSVAWSGNLKQAIDEAQAQRQKTGERKLVFIDFTGKSCTNCSINENTVFSKPEFQELFRNYNLVQLYTDVVPNEFYAPGLRSKFGNDTDRQDDDAEANLRFQREAFGTEQLPLYVILEPLTNGKIDVLGIYSEGKINDEAAFAEFLKKPLDTGGGPRAQASGR